LSRSAGAGSLQRTSSGRIGLIDELALKESTIRSRTSLSLILACALVGAAVVVPARADTESELDSAEQQLESARAELDRANQLWQEAEAELGRSRDAAEAARARIEVLQTELGRIRRELNERAASLFIAGGNPQAIALLTSESVSDAVDRMEFASAVAEGDSDLANQVAVESQELAWQQEQLAEAISRQEAAVEQIEAQQSAIQDELARYAARVEELEDQLAAERAAAERAAAAAADASGGGTGGTGNGGSPAPVTGTGWIQTCPVNGPNSFIDSFGDPRSGGRSHAGIDMISPKGTPVVAVHSGTVHHTGSSIGGLGIVIFHDGSSDWTFYTHFSAYGAYGEGAHVSAGTTIGYVGNSGTTVYHLHFEYHPGGGAAINPYTALLGVC
jgi:murein DD-endopeptidase MepM/ murein hydrolase activator NlpD